MVVIIGNSLPTTHFFHCCYRLLGSLPTWLIYVSGSRKRNPMEQTKKMSMLIKSYNLSQLSAKILEGKTFDVQRNWQLNWAVFSKAIELEIKIT